MTITPISHLENQALDWAVSKALGYSIDQSNNDFYVHIHGRTHPLSKLNYHNNWDLSGPILDQEEIHLCTSNGKGYFIGEEVNGLRWLARYRDGLNEIGRTPIEAFLRAFVVKKLQLASSIEIPNGLA